MARFWHSLRTHAVALAAALAVAVLGGVQLLCRPIVGLADNKDYWRVTWRAGVAYIPGTFESSFFRFIQLKWQVIPPWPSSKIKYLTSEVPIARVAVLLNGLLRGSRDFDLRVLGAFHLVLYAVAIFLLLTAVRVRRRGTQVLVAALTVFMFTDVRLIAYFNSFYSESASLIFGVATFALALLLCCRQVGLRGWLLYLAFLVTLAFFCLAKSQNLVFVPSLAVLMVVLFPPLPGRLGSCWRALALVPALALLLTMAWALTSDDAYRASRATNVMVHLDEELLRYSPNPARDLAELGIVKRDYSKTTFGDIAKFYLRHPGRWWQVGKRGAAEAFSSTLLGNFEAKATTPAHLTSEHFNTWSELKRRLVPRSLPLFVVVAVVLSGLGLLRWFSARTPEVRRRTLVLLALLAGCIGEFFVTVTFEANGTAKHLFIFNVLVDLLLLLLLAELVDLLVDRWKAHG